MKSITLHPLSVLAGLALAGLAFLATAAAQTPIPTTRTVFLGELPASWWIDLELEYLNGAQVQSYTVPAGRSFVLTTASTGFYADNQSTASRVGAVLPGVGNGTRIVFASGTLLTAEDTNATYQGRYSVHVWGYLAPN